MPGHASKVARAKAGTTPYRLSVAAASVALGTLVPVALYQSGMIAHLPDPPGDAFDSDRITSSKSAHPLGIPDSLLGLGSYGVTLGLVLLARRSGAAREALGAKLMVDGSMAVFNFTRQVVSYRRLCSWCTGTALATAVLAPAGRAYLKQLQGGE